MKDQLANLERASVELARGFQRAGEFKTESELLSALVEASAALIEMRRANDQLIQQLRRHSRIPSR